MLPDEILEKIFANSKVQKMSNIEQSNMIDAVEQLFADLKEERPYVSIAELLSADE